MRFALNTGYIASAISNAIENKIGKQELDLYEAIVFDDLKVHTPSGIRRIQNNLEDYYNHVVNIQEVYRSKPLAVPYNINVSDKRHLLNHLTHVDTSIPQIDVTSPTFSIAQGVPDLLRDLYNNYAGSLSSNTTNKFIPNARSHSNSFIIEQLVYADSFLTEEAYRTFTNEYVAYDLLSTLLFRLDALVLSRMVAASTLFAGFTPFVTPVTPPAVNYKDLIETFFLYHTYHKFDKDSYFCGLFLNINEFRRFMLLKSNDGEYLICNNCMLNDIIEYQQAKIFAVPNTNNNAFINSQRLLFWVNTHVYFVTDGKLYLTYRHNYSNNTHEFMLELMFHVVPSQLFLDNFGNTGSTLSISYVTLATTSAV